MKDPMPGTLKTSTDAEPHVEAESEVRRADSGERAYSTIRALLMDFTLRPGERINEMQLSRNQAYRARPFAKH
jgi:hypothetical protein